MNKIVKALRAQGYRLVTARLSTQETAEWNSMVSEEIMLTIRPTLSLEDNLQWDLMLIEEELNSSISIR